MATLAGLIGGFAAMVVACLLLLIPITLLGLDQYKGPGSHALIYALVGASLSVFVIVGTSIKNWVRRTRNARHKSDRSNDEAASPKQKSSASGGNQKQYDTEKWNALLKYDEDIAKVAEQLRGFGDKWVDVFAQDFLALNDKKYLPSIVEKIISDAKAERDEFKDKKRTDEGNRSEQQQTPVPEKNSHITAIILVSCAVILTALGALELFRTWHIHETLLAARTEAQKQLPIKYKGNITLVDVHVGYLSITYVNSVADEGRPQFNAQLANLKKDVRKGICASEDMKGMLKSGVSYSYEYRDTIGAVIVEFVVDSCP